MANPFFIPDQTAHNTEPLNQAIGNYLKFKGIEEHARLGDQSNQRLLEQNLLTAQNQAAQRDIDTAKLKPSQQTFSAAHIRPYLTNITGRKVEKHWQPFTDALMQHVSNKNMNAGMVHDDIAQNFETVYKPLIRNALLAEAQAAPEGTDLKEYDKKLQAIEEMTGEQAAKSILPGVWNERQNERAALQANKPNRKQITEMTSPDGKTAQKFSVDVETGDMTPLGNPYLVKSQVTNVNVRSGGSGSETHTMTPYVDDNGVPLVYNKKTRKMERAIMEPGTKATPQRTILNPKQQSELDMYNEFFGGGGKKIGTTYKHTAKDKAGNRIGSNDGINWTPIK